MCGVVGFLERKPESKATGLQSTIERMSEALTHRGPDDSGVWVDERAGLALGFRRLAILDLSEAGHQPMRSASGRYVMVYNGEVYNFGTLRKQLEAEGNAPRWRGHSDTEVMLACVEAWGLEQAVQSFVGMFAFALWDQRERCLHLGRDRIGVKPLYYGWINDAFLFGSELEALRRFPRFEAEIDRAALALMLRHSYVPSPYCIYRNLRKLQPGCTITVRAEELTPPAPRAYWSAREVVEEAAAHPWTGTESEAIDSLDDLLREAISLRMISDVPLGVFLSGGIDSSTVAALMQAQSSRPVKTFSIGFHEDGYDEARHARDVAKHLGSEHTELYLTHQEARAVVPKLPQIYDEPFADCSQIPTHLVSALARRHVTVSLSGDGGDEFFGGYNRYIWVRRLWERMKWSPSALRGLAARGLNTLTPGDWDKLFSTLEPLLPSGLRPRLPGDKLSKLAEILPLDGPEQIYLGLASHWKRPLDIVRGGHELFTPPTDRESWPHLSDYTEKMMYFDLITYLPDDIMAKVDRASMAVSLEAREPLLDHRLLRFAWRLPLSFKLRDGQGKWILRQVLYRYVPKSLIERPKMGFAVPIDSWLRGPLRDWAEALLEPRRLEEEGYLNPAPIRARWEEHLSGKRNWQHHIWDVLMFQAWLESLSSS